MVFTRKYNLVNNLTGWGVFIVALLTYWLTLEPTASYWDCGEFIIQADKLEIGHPPGNPIFMLTARFFANFAFGDQTLVAVMVNAMSGLLSALTILLLFWTVTHLVRRLTVKDNAAELSLPQYLVIMGSGLCGALAYAWSDTFWFSAVEGEVYAFSSFCTALVVWLMLKWENRADEPYSDRYLILIAYIIGVSIAVHLLNLLCIPAIVLVYCYRKVPDMNVKKSLVALAVGFAIIVMVLYGLVPGFIEVAGWFELFAVNVLYLPFNTGLIVYALLTLGCFVWALYELHTQRSAQRIRISFMLAALISGIAFMGSGLLLGVLLLGVLGFMLFVMFRSKLPVRWLNIAMWSIAVIFVGYSSYGLILIRSNSRTPMNQNAPDNVFDLSSYLNREQYGQVPLLYGQTFESQAVNRVENYSNPQMSGASEQQLVGWEEEQGKPRYAKGVKDAKTNVSGEHVPSRDGDFYALYDYDRRPVMNPELNILLPRIHSTMPSHSSAYALWVPGLYQESDMVPISAIEDATGAEVPLLEADYAYDEALGQYKLNADSLLYHEQVTAHRPTMSQNMEFFFNYQLNHMYWRYFLWNFAGRQNDINNQLGELDAGNWLSGIPFIDNARLGDQSLLPDEMGEGNPAHNVFYMLPLLLGILGLLWQAFRDKRGIEQFWVVFFLFFMTGIAIVLYLNQPPLQARERDYAYAGSFYAFAIWIGMGVAAIDSLLRKALVKKGSKAKTPEAGTVEAPQGETGRKPLLTAALAALIGLLVPLQMVSQTWDDHDRSGRYAARDYAINYLNSLEPNAIIFCNGDNDTFPLWYAQEVEGVRPDVKIINLSYLGSAWYADQQRMPTYTAAPVHFTAKSSDYAYDRLASAIIAADNPEEIPLLESLKEIYSGKTFNSDYGMTTILHNRTYIPIDAKVVRGRGLVPEGINPLTEIPVQLNSMSMSEIMMMDIIATNAADGWKRPIYWACTVGSEYYQQFLPYVRSTGMAYQLVPYQANGNADAELSYASVKKYRWGGADNYAAAPYFDETAGRMLSAVRSSVLDAANALLHEALIYRATGNDQKAEEKFRKCKELLQIYEKRLAGNARPANSRELMIQGDTWCSLGYYTNDKASTKHGLDILEKTIVRFAKNVRYADAVGDMFGTLRDAEGNFMLNVQLTSENSTILNTYYPLIQLYNRYDYVLSKNFNEAECTEEILSELPLGQAALKVLKKAGISNDMLERLKGYSSKQVPSTDAASDFLSEDDMAALSQELMQYVKTVARLQAMSPEEYAAAPEEDRMTDSVFYYVLQQYAMYAGTDDTLLNSSILDQVDLERSEKLFNDLLERHPEYAAEQ